ncbi:phosphatase [Ruminiclostridium cellulolyticum]|uniref:PHP domain protein n=1 Tax=Ruminiclostridium cellulolyticum (strain ATCC 35319 / DSM 5812 / JCM 6584 / H10) TaxID=394503 RepID=B8I4X5_RUMCH|nr:phosphatase [Ruminiclostridium cellulolyticum]ACL76629.1 PHP domain protein [Ruminiclostridium cellulolyticum H10]
MKIVVDTHTHTVSSGHAYSTVQENAKEAYTNGIHMINISDHGSAMKGAPFLYYFGNLEVIPDSLYGVRIIHGVELNIMDYNGTVDLPERYLKKLGLVLASFHDICIEPSTVENHTNGAVEILKNPYIDILAHPGNPQFQIDIEKVVKTAKEYNKLIELNNHSFVVRKGSERNCFEIARMCKKYGVRVATGSDAHISFNIGRFDNVMKILEEVEMPEELVVTTSVERMESYLSERKKRIE